MTILLDTPEQISMWVLLSRRSQLKLQGKGLKTKGLFAWLKRNGISESRNWQKALLDLNDVIGDNGGPEDPDVNYRLFMGRTYNGRFTGFDEGVFPTLESVTEFYTSQGYASEYVINRTFEGVTNG